jgi:hypothetical protein
MTLRKLQNTTIRINLDGILSEEKLAKEIASKPHLRKILIISEDPVEILICQNTFGNLNCEIEVANTLPDVITYSQRFFDWVLISNQVRSFGINFITLLFTRFRSKETSQPQQFLFTNEQAFPAKQIPSSLLQYQALDGLMVLRRAA